MSNLPPGVTQRMLDREFDETDQQRYEAELESAWDDLLDWFADIKTSDYSDNPAHVMRELFRVFPHLKKPMYFVENPEPPRVDPDVDDYDPTDRW